MKNMGMEQKKIVDPQEETSPPRNNAKEILLRLEKFYRETEQDPMGRVLFFRDKIRKLALTKPALKGINVEKLGETDMLLFDLCIQGYLSLSQIEQQRKILDTQFINLKEETEDSKKVLDYLKEYLSRTLD